MLVLDTIKSTIINAFLRRKVILWLCIYKILYLFGVRKNRYGYIVAALFLLVLVFMNFYFSPTLQNILEDHCSTEQTIQGLSNLIQSIGIALIGVSVIFTSLVLFAMQINIRRMPYGLFHRLSTDGRLLGAFVFSFLFAMGIAILSILTTQIRLASMLILTGCLIISILVLLAYAYWRALKLINPYQQLEILVNDSKKELQFWQRKSKRISPFLQIEEKIDATASPMKAIPDLDRIIFFKLPPNWNDGARQKIQYAILLARHYAEQGDYEISDCALDAIIDINKAYIHAKGEIFHAHEFIFNSPWQGDKFINSTLEYLEKNMQHGIARQDEQQIEQILHTIATLVRLYIDIDYLFPRVQKIHANLAADYLENAISSIIPHNMANALLKGQRCMGESATIFFNRDDSYGGGIALSKNISYVACMGCTKKEYWPVTIEGMRQLSNLTIVNMVSLKGRDVRFIFTEICNYIENIVIEFILSPNQLPLQIHIDRLSPYYSSTSPEGFLSKLTELANKISKSTENDADIQRIIHNIMQWAEQIPQAKKRLLHQSIEAKSSFTYDILVWIKDVTKILLTISKAKACDEEIGEAIREYAYRLVAILYWASKDENIIIFKVTENLFEIAIDAHNQGCDNTAKKIEEILLSWTFKAGKYQTDFNDTLTTDICGVAVFALMRNEEEAIKLRIQSYLSEDSAPNQKICDHTAQQIRNFVVSLPRSYQYSYSPIEMAMNEVDQKKLRLLLEDIAEILSPSI